MSVVSVAQAGGNPAKEHRMRLVVEMGEVQKLDGRAQLHEKRDEQGFSELKKMAGLM